MAGAWVDLRCRSYGAQLTARLQVSLPKVGRGHNANLSDPQAVPALLGYVFEEVSAHFPGLLRLEEFHLSRLDVARDFVNVADMATRMQDLSRLAPIRARHSFFADDQIGVRTLRRWARAWETRLYDKDHELSLQAAKDPETATAIAIEAVRRSRPNLLRFELQLNSAAIKKIGGWHNLDKDALSVVAFDYFKRSRFDEPLGDEAILRAAEESLRSQGRIAEAIGLLKYLSSKAHGLQRVYCRNTIDKYDRLARELGLTHLDTSTGRGDGGRLDWTTGTVVPR